MKFTLEPCIPPFWASSGHAQTVWGHVLSSPALARSGERVEVPLPGGDRLVGSYFGGASGTAVSLFHGLSGSVDSDYIARTARVCLAQGHSVFAFNHRGCGSGAGLAREPYHSGRAEDLSEAIDCARSRLPGHRQLSIGFSLSGNALLLLMSGKRGGTRPDAAISVNAPIDLKSSAALLGRGFNRVYDLRFVRKCRAEIARRRETDPTMPDYRIPAFATLQQVDEIYTAPAGGFADRDDYYRSCSTRDLLALIDRPTLLLTARDDPFVDVRSYEGAGLSRSVQLHIEDVGGHMGYLSARKTPLGSHRWLDYALDEAIRFVAGSMI